MAPFKSFLARIGGLFILLIGLYAAAAAAQQVDVSGQVNITKSGLVFNRTTRTFDSVLTLTNSLIPISGPVSLVITSITPNTVTLANASGTTTAGQPYINIPPPSNPWALGATTTAVLKFSNPSQISFTFTAQVLATVQPVTGGNFVISAIDTNGGIVTLPGVASLNVPPGTVSSAAIQIQQMSFPQAPFLIDVLPGFTLLNAPSLKIKSSVEFSSPTILRITVPGLQGQLAAGSAPQILALQPAGDDDSGASQEFDNLGGAACGDGNDVCVLLSPGAFLPNPLDPTDPVISLIIAAGPAPTTATTPLWQLNSQSNAPTQPVSASQATFAADILLNKTFSFASAAPLSFNVITSAFKRRRCVSVCRSHLGVDLLAAIDTDVYSPYEGTLMRKMAGTSPTALLFDNLQHNVSAGGLTLYTQYLHLDPLASLNQPVNVARSLRIDISTLEDFAKSGISGHVLAHLHFDATLSGTHVDSRPLLGSTLGQPVDNLSLYLLPPDDADLLRGTEQSRLFLMLYVNGVPQDSSGFATMPLGELRLPSLYSYIKTKGIGFGTDATPEIQNATITPLPPIPSGSSISTPSSSGGATLLSFNSGPIDFQAALGEAATRAGAADVNLFLRDNKVDVRLLWDNFRFGMRFWEVAKWNVTALFDTQVTASGLPNPANVGQSVTLSAQVSPVPGQVIPQGLVPGGTVTFAEGMQVLCGAPVQSDGSASCSTSFSMAGSHNITAQYGGNQSFANSTGQTTVSVIGLVPVFQVSYVRATPSCSTSQQFDNNGILVDVTDCLYETTATVSCVDHCGNLPNYDLYGSHEHYEHTFTCGASDILIDQALPVPPDPNAFAFFHFSQTQRTFFFVQNPRSDIQTTTGSFICLPVSETTDSTYLARDRVTGDSTTFDVVFTAPY